MKPLKIITMCSLLATSNIAISQTQHFENNCISFNKIVNTIEKEIINNKDYNLFFNNFKNKENIKFKFIKTKDNLNFTETSSFYIFKYLTQDKFDYSHLVKIKNRNLCYKQKELDTLIETYKETYNKLKINKTNNGVNVYYNSDYNDSSESFITLSVDFLRNLILDNSNKYKSIKSYKKYLRKFETNFSSHIALMTKDEREKKRKIKEESRQRKLEELRKKYQK